MITRTIPSPVPCEPYVGPVQLGEEWRRGDFDLRKLVPAHVSARKTCTRMPGRDGKLWPMQTSSGNGSGMVSSGNGRCMGRSAYIVKAVVSTASFPAAHIGSGVVTLLELTVSCESWTSNVPSQLNSLSATNLRRPPILRRVRRRVRQLPRRTAPRVAERGLGTH